MSNRLKGPYLASRGARGLTRRHLFGQLGRAVCFGVLGTLTACRNERPATETTPAPSAMWVPEASAAGQSEPAPAGAGALPAATPGPELAVVGVKPTPVTVRPSQWWGYIPNFDYAAAWSAAEVHRDALTGVAVVQFHPDYDGDLITFPGGDYAPARAAAQGLTTVPVIANSYPNGWNREVIAHVLSVRWRRRYHVEQIVAMVVEGNHPAVEIDYENLSDAEREPFSRFIDDLAGELHDQGKQLAVAVHAKASDPGEWAGARAQDWGRIGAAADRVIVLTYDYDPARPSPIAPLSWTKDVLRHAVSRIDPAKVIQAVPLYGYDWASGAPGVGRTYQELLELARQHGVQPRREWRDLHVIFDYSGRRDRHQVWLSDGATVAALMALGREVGLGGYAFWRLGGEDPAVWSALAAERAASMSM
jgi:spore germination protein